MDNSSGNTEFVQSCISCKKGISDEYTLYQCNCCCIIICPECVCLAKVATASLVKLSLPTNLPSSTAVVTPPTEMPQQQGSLTIARPSLEPVQVKRKPVGTGALHYAVSPAVVASVPNCVSEPQVNSSYMPPQISDQSQPAVSLGTIPSTQQHYVSSDNQQVFPTRPELQHSSTVPPPSMSEEMSAEGPRRSMSFPRSLSLPSSLLTDKRKSVSNLFSVETGKKIAKNKWVRAGAKYGANLAMRAVVNDVVSDLVTNINLNSNDDSGGGANNTDSDTGQDSGFDTAALAQQVLLSSINENTVSPDILQTPSPDFANADYTALLQQQQAAINLNNAIQQQNFATANMANSAIQQANAFQQDGQYQASTALNWGTDAAVPGVISNTYRSSSAGATQSNSFASSNFQKQLSNASAGV